MTKAADLIDALLARKPGRPVLDRRSGLPYAWGHWVRTRDVVAQVAYGSPEMIEVAAARPTRRVGGVLPALSAWQAFRRLWWQQWDPRPRDERPYHWLAVLGSFLIHALFLLLLLWVAVVRWGQPPEPAGEEGRVRLEFVGRGGPEQTGGGPGEPAADSATPGAAPQRPERRPQASSAATPPATTAAPSVAGDTPSPVAEAPSPPQPQSQPDAEPASIPPPQPVQAPAMAMPAPRIVEPRISSQPLQVTETVVPTHDFVVPPRQVEVQLPTPRQVVTPQVQVIERQVEVVQQPVLVAPQLREIDVAVETSQAPAVREREVATVDAPRIELPVPIAREVAAPPARAPEVQVRQIEVPSPAEASARETSATSAASSAPAAVAPTSAAAATPAETAASTSPAPSLANASGRDAGATAPGESTHRAATPQGQGSAAAARVGGNPAATGGSGPRAASRSGGWDSATRGDDWSVGQQNRAGDAGGQGTRGSQGQGLFNADGSVRLAGDGDAVAADRGAPGGDADSWSRERISSAGTWLKRPPYDYTPTSFDQYWVPNESLLAEWVRKGLKKVEIPIPGTNTRISCVVSLLQFGGGCGLRDPNVNDQPAQARPPPDIPFKKELQEANGAGV